MDDHDSDFYLFNDAVLMDNGIAASSVMIDTDNEVSVRRENPYLNEEKRRRIVYSLLNMKKGNTLPYGAQSKLAAEFNVHKSTINCLFKRAREFSDSGGTIDVSSKRKGNCGRKRYDNSEEWLEFCPLNLRGTTRAYARYLGCSHHHIWKLIKQGVLRVHTSATHPHVSEKNKMARMKWVLSHIIPGTNTQKARFVDMKHTVHVDEKGFYLNPRTRSFYMLPKETDPYRSTKHKNCSIKVMFMCATSRPIYGEDGHLTHDGKFGIWPFIFREQAKKKTSKNRPAGTWETKVNMYITQDVSRDMLVNKVFPAIREKWPACLSKDIIIQQDNAPPHITNNDPAFREAATQDGFNMVLINQPAQSLDFNVLDLGLFRAIQSLQYQTFPEHIDDLVVKVNEAYDKFDPTRIRYAWITLQYVMIEALKCKGGNEFKIPHIGKAKLDRRGELVDNVEVDQEIIDEAVEYISAQEQGNHSSAARRQQLRNSGVVEEHHNGAHVEGK